MAERIIAGVGSSWDAKARKLDETKAVSWDEARRTDPTISLSYDKPVPINAPTAIVFAWIKSLNSLYTLNYSDDFDKIDTTDRLVTDGLGRVDPPLNTVPWGEQINPTDQPSADLPYYGILPSKDRIRTASHHSVYRFDEKPVREVYEYYLPTFDLAFGAPLARLSFSFDDPTGYEPKTLPIPVGLVSQSRWQSTQHIDLNHLMPWGWSRDRAITGGPYKTVFLVPEDETDPTDPVDPTEPPDIERSYTIVNVVNLVSLPDLTPIPFDAGRLNRDLDTYAWTFTANLATQTAVDLVSPKSGALKEVRLTINGDVWEFFVSKISHNKAFAKDSWQFTAYSRSKLLAAPYSAQGARTETSGSTAAQIANDELFGTGFTVDWSAVDWSLPANVFSYSGKAPIEAIGMLSSAIGAVIESHPSAYEISIKPRFNESSWNWSTATEDRTMPRAIFKEWSEEFKPQASYNAVYVSGQEHGVVAKVKQLGTAGDQLMGDITDSLLTDQIANAERGRIELSKAGHKEVFSGKVFYDGTGFVNIGELVKVVATDGSFFKGVVTSNSIEITRMGAVVYQNLQILRHFDE